MKQISRVFNDIVFLLNREGEMPGDLKKEYFYNGVHYCDVARIEFNELHDSVRELMKAQEKQSSISGFINEYEEQSKPRANLIPVSKSEELKLNERSYSGGDKWKRKSGNRAQRQ